MSTTGTPAPTGPCPHLNFEAVVEIGRIEPDAAGIPKAYMAEIRVNCEPPPAGCGEKFRWTGPPAGMSYAEPRVSPDETVLRAPLRPASADPDSGMGLPGFAIRRVL